MKQYNLSNMLRGWFIGNFEPSILKTSFIEVGVVSHKKDEEWPAHFHSSSIEINLVLDGSLTINNKLFEKNDFFILERNEVSKPKFLENCRILVIRVPDIQNDKVIV